MEQIPATTGGTDPALKSSWLELSSPDLVFAGMLLVALAISIYGICKAVSNIVSKSQEIPGKRDLLWIALVSQAVVATVAMLLVAGIAKLLSPDSLSTLLTILVTAIGVKLFDANAKMPKVGGKGNDE